MTDEKGADQASFAENLLKRAGIGEPLPISPKRAFQEGDIIWLVGEQDDLHVLLG